MKFTEVQDNVAKLTMFVSFARIESWQNLALQNHDRKPCTYIAQRPVFRLFTKLATAADVAAYLVMSKSMCMYRTHQLSYICI